MQTSITQSYLETDLGKRANEILRNCVHCGFCNATCPTYQLLGDELDGPRGRIYLIKQILEGKQPTEKTQLHLDRCLTCRNCETTCPSGVKYSSCLTPLACSFAMNFFCISSISLILSVLALITFTFVEQPADASYLKFVAEF